MNTYVVTGLGFGDESKGSITDYLARQASTVVVRHNGGPQAGHNVATSDGKSHCFSQYGAGTLAGAKTFLSRFMLVNPLNMLREGAHLKELGITGLSMSTFVDDEATLITPYHVAINRLLELSRGADRHGSTGQGVGVAMQQDIDMPGHSLRVKDIPDFGFWPRVEAQRMYLEKKYHYLRGNSSHWSAVDDPDLSQHIVNRFRDWFRTVQVVKSEHLGALARNAEQLVFEGAQGVLLDQHYGLHPYTTWATCTHENALTLLREVAANSGEPQARDAPLGALSNPIKLGVIRAVTTRHGAGPLPTEDRDLTATWAEPHNATNEWQGPFRVGHLDLAIHRYGNTVCGGIDQVAVTHLDRGGPVWKYCDHYLPHTVKIPLGRRGDLVHQENLTRKLFAVQPAYTETDEAGLLSAISTNLGAPVAITSHGPTADDKRVTVPVTA